MKTGRFLRLAVLGVAVTGVAFCSLNFMTAESRVRKLCEQMPPGMTIEALLRFARANDLGPAFSVSQDSGTRYLVESGTFGRFGCRVEIGAGRVRSSAYHFSD